MRLQIWICDSNTWLSPLAGCKRLTKTLLVHPSTLWDGHQVGQLVRSQPHKHKPNSKQSAGEYSRLYVGCNYLPWPHHLQSAMRWHRQAPLNTFLHRPINSTLLYRHLYTKISKAGLQGGFESTISPLRATLLAPLWVQMRTKRLHIFVAKQEKQLDDANLKMNKITGITIRRPLCNVELNPPYQKARFRCQLTFCQQVEIRSLSTVL